MEIEKSKVSIQYLLFFRQSGNVLFFLYARRLCGYTATGLTQGCSIMLITESLMTTGVRIRVGYNSFEHR